jgi:hypothetical protein
MPIRNLKTPAMVKNESLREAFATKYNEQFNQTLSNIKMTLDNSPKKRIIGLNKIDSIDRTKSDIRSISRKRKLTSIQKLTS